jgi:hypothetical protein
MRADPDHKARNSYRAPKAGDCRPVEQVAEETAAAAGFSAATLALCSRLSCGSFTHCWLAGLGRRADTVVRLEPHVVERSRKAKSRLLARFAASSSPDHRLNNPAFIPIAEN